MTDLESTRAVAARLGVTPRHVARLVASGRLVPAMKLDGETGPFLFDPQHVTAFLAEREATGVETGGDAA